MAAPHYLVIRKEQLEVLGQPQREEFLVKGVAHARKLFPKKAARLGDDGLRALVEQAVKDAAAHGIESEKNVLLYSDLHVALGHAPGTGDGESWLAELFADRARSENVRLHVAYQHLATRCPRAGDDP